MKRALSTLLLTALFPTTPLLAADETGNMSGMKGMEMDGHPAMGQAMAAHKATGVVKAIDSANGTVTIAHGAVTTLNWPAMKMGFKADQVMLDTLKVGEQVEFEFVAQGMTATLTKIVGVK